ncbi:MAG: hypothetical protein HPY74_06020 [Firmicutes bacterium]|nr:hypothetical protein [Bacillota bacterium]
MSDEIDKLKDAAGEYKKYALEARKKFINIRHVQDIEIKSLYIRLAERVASRIKSLNAASSPLRKSQLEQVEKLLVYEAGNLNENLSKYMRKYIDAAVDAGTGYSKAIAFKMLDGSGLEMSKVNQSFFRINRNAVKACWNETKGGLKLSDRIWKQGETARKAITEIIQESVATGMDAVKTARLLEKYVNEDARTLVKDYPELMDRLHGKVPGNLSYEALRLARTETTKAFGKGTIEAAKNSPGCKGIKWVLSPSHPATDICDALARNDEGLGAGVYQPDNVPEYPAHPNEMCILVTIYESSDDFKKRLKRWRDNPESEPGLEKWYQRTYNGITDGAIQGLKTVNLSPGYNDMADIQAIVTELMLIPYKHIQMLKEKGVKINTGWNKVSGFYADDMSIRILKEPEYGEVIHEVGHALSYILDLYNDDEFIKVLNAGIDLKQISRDNLIINLQHSEGFIMLQHEGISKFVSDLQAKVYRGDYFIPSENGTIFNTKLLKEYFAEGYREYFIDPENLKSRDMMLYRFIERMVKE